MRIRFIIITILLCACSSKKEETHTPPANGSVSSINIDGVAVVSNMKGVGTKPLVLVKFSQPVKTATAGISMLDATGNAVTTRIAFQNNDSTITVQPSAGLQGLARYQLVIPTTIEFANGGKLRSGMDIAFYTGIDPSKKFPVITDEELLTKIQQQTFKYFWDFAHPVSGLAKERSNGDNEVVTSGGSGFGIMALVVAVNRNFISRQQGVERMMTIVDFLKNTAETFKGAYPHWLNGTTGKAVPFSTNDDGADLVETSYLIQGLLCAAQYFDRADVNEQKLRDDIDIIWKRVEWDWFRANNQNVLYWHWSAKNANGWVMNLPIKGWNECLITYVLAAASPTHPIPRNVYDEGWAANGGMINGNKYFDYQLPLGPAMGGPLFFSHYSFLGLNPMGLSDGYADYELQTRNHSLINYSYCVANPKTYYGYSDSCWGLTASDIKDGYTASSPANDVGVIAPTAAISSLPYTPQQSMQALKFFYYTLGDKLWKNYGFVDAFSLNEPWFAESFLAIDQGPQIIMIENYRTGLLWNLFMNNTEVKAGLHKLGFTGAGL